MRKSELNMRRGTAAQWTSLNPVLSSGEPGFETDTKKFKVGDGSTAWSGLRYAGFDGGDLDARVIDPLGSHTYSGTTIVLSNYFTDSPVYALKGVTGSSISVPVGFNRAVYIDASGNVTQEDVTSGQVLTFKSEILLGAKDYPCEDEGLAAGKCIDKYRVDRTARFPQKFQPCPSVCRDDTGKDCNCSSSSSSGPPDWFCDNKGGCREVAIGSLNSYPSREYCEKDCCSRTDGAYQAGRGWGCDPNCNTKQAICADIFNCAGGDYFCNNCIDYSQPTIPWGIACNCNLSPKNGCECLDAGFGNGGDCMGAWCEGADKCLCVAGSYLQHTGALNAGPFMRGANCGITFMGLSDEDEDFRTLSLCKYCGDCKKCDESGSCVDDPACSSSSSPYTTMLNSSHITIEW
jgi:hypothetical protein